MMMMVTAGCTRLDDQVDNDHISDETTGRVVNGTDEQQFKDNET